MPHRHRPPAQQWCSSSWTARCCLSACPAPARPCPSLPSAALTRGLVMVGPSGVGKTYALRAVQELWSRDLGDLVVVRAADDDGTLIGDSAGLQEAQGIGGAKKRAKSAFSGRESRGGHGEVFHQLGAAVLCEGIGGHAWDKSGGDQVYGDEADDGTGKFLVTE
ncbi:ATP-binding protein [archaeon]|nr:MAG: ATP-binding protein [archaeon]